jgi:two-component system NtrC family sensor kinase
MVEPGGQTMATDLATLLDSFSDSESASAYIVRLAERVSHAVSRGGDSLALAGRVCRTIAGSSIFSAAWVGLLDADMSQIVVRQYGFGRSFRTKFRAKGCGGCVATLVRSMGRCSTLIRSHQQEPCSACVLAGQSPRGHSLIVKLEHQSRVVGALALTTPFDIAFNDEQKAILHGLGTELGLAFYGSQEKAKAEASRKESENLYRTIFENTGTLLWVVEPDGTISLANGVSESLTGFTREETENRKTWEDFFVKQDVHRMRRYRRARLQSTGGHAAKQFQARLVAKNGRVRTVLVSPGVITGTKRMIPSMIDITARKRAELDVRRLNEYLQAIVDNANVLVVLLDRRGIVRVWNRAAERITGYWAREMVGKAKSLRRLVPYPITAQAVNALVRRVSAGEAIEDLEASIMTSDGRSRLVSWYAKGVMDRNGRLQGVVVLGRDVTSHREMEEKRKDAEARAQHAERLAAIGKMAAGVAHEINNPLTGIVGLAELLQRQDLPPTSAEFVRAILEGGERIARIVDSLLTFAGKHELVPQAVSVNECLRHVMTCFESRLSEAGIRVYAQFDETEPSVGGDPTWLEQAFRNLLANALDELRSIDTERRLLIRTSVTDDSVEVEVQDTGRGIPQSALKKVFEPFYTTKPPGKGTGLGLSICHGLIAEHGGRVYARNNAGAGAAFVVELPLLM